MASRPSSERALSAYRRVGTEARGRYLGEQTNRVRAPRILSPGEVSGDYDAARMLGTTLHGDLRAITTADLQAFRLNVQAAGKRFRGGITAKGVIDLSLPEDRDRANRQIRTAVPYQSIGGRVHFITNAGPDSDVTRHHVHIELLNFSAALSSPAKPDDLVKTVTAGPLKFDCDCGRHTYWYRYIATIGRFNAGRDETGFPKIRNPNLRGVACKHVLRVMQQLSAPAIKHQVSRMIEVSRKSVDRKLQVLSKKDAQHIASQQSKQAGWKRNTVESIAEKRLRLSRQRAIQAALVRARPPRPVPRQASPRKIEAAKRQFELNARKLAGMGVLNQKQLDALLSKVRGRR